MCYSRRTSACLSVPLSGCIALIGYTDSQSNIQPYTANQVKSSVTSNESTCIVEACSKDCKTFRKPKYGLSKRLV